MALSNTSVARWVQQNFYSKSQLTSGQLDSVYYNQTAFVNASAGAGDAGKPVKLNASGLIDSTMMSGGTVATHAALTAAHGATGAVVGTTNAQTLSSKTLTDPVIARIYGGTGSAGTLTLSSTTHATKGKIIFGTSAYDETNARIGIGTTSPTMALDVSGSARASSNIYVLGVTDTGNDGIRFSYNSGSGYIDTKGSGALNFRLDNTNGGTQIMAISSTGVTVTGAIAATTGTINSVNIVTESATQTLTNKTLTSPTLTTPTISGTGFTNATHTHSGASSGGTIAHSSLTSAGSNSHATIDTHLSAVGGEHGIAGNFVGTSDSQTLTNKTLTLPVIAQISNTGTLTLPTSTDTLVGRATTDTLTNKTLTSPTINTPTMTSASTDTLNITGNTLKIANARAPASASDTGVAGEICWHPSTAAIYVCVATNTWKRALLSTF
jgi:hypothetical protein